MMRPCTTTLVLLLLTLDLLPTAVRAMFQDEIGKSDFTVVTAGHGYGGVGSAWLTSDGESLITSSSYGVGHGWYDEDAVGDDDGEEGEYILGPYVDSTAGGRGGGTSSCNLSSRSVATGKVQWRRNVCGTTTSTSSSPSSYFAYASKLTGNIYTLDNTGTFRKWDESNGGLLFDTVVTSSGSSGGQPKVFGIKLQDKEVIGTVLWNENGDNEVLTLHDANTGSKIGPGPIDAKQILADAKVRSPGGSGSSRPAILGILDGGTILVGYVNTDQDEIQLNGGIALMIIELSTLRTTTADGEEVTTTYQVLSNPTQVKVGDGNVKSSVLARTVQIFATTSTSGTTASADDDGSNNKINIVGVATGGSSVASISIDPTSKASVTSASGGEVSLSTLHPQWTAVHSVHPQPSAPTTSGDDAKYLAISGTDSRYPQTRLTTSLYTYDTDKGRVGEQIFTGPKVHLDEETEYDATVYCSGNQIVLEREGNGGKVTVKAFEVKGGQLMSKLDVTGDVTLPIEEAVIDAEVLSCTANNMQILAKTSSKMTALLDVKLTGSSGGVEVDLAWTAEESLASVTDSIFLDETNIASSAAARTKSENNDEEEALLQSLTFSSRLSSQIDSFVNFVTGGFVSDVTSIFMSASGLESADADSKKKEHAFGFAKVAVLLSPSAVFGMDMSTASSSARGTILWKMTLDPNAAWSKIIHGGATTKSLAGGGQDKHAIHSHEILVLSYVPAVGSGSRKKGLRIGWRCIDGLTGKIHSEGSVNVASPVAQIIPIHVSHHEYQESCRQVVSILHADETVSVIPDTRPAKAAVNVAINKGAGQHGLYGHTINRDTGVFQTYRIVSPDETEITAQQVGGSTFMPEQEKIVTVAYPKRNEVVQSPALILGDDSLLLSYLNPHLSVVVTAATEEYLASVEESAADSVAKALGGSGGGQKAKPLGATKPGEEAPAVVASAASPPSVFINLVDTVSGRILHRTSHAGAAPTGIPVLISENWVIYALSNLKSRRTELGVLSLHEGMIDKKGITAFSAPEQELTFSSFTSPKPVVLAKTYTITSPVTALGVTTTKEGISMKQILMATGEGGQVIGIDRRMLDPRRPTGEVKASEKKEGLHKYHPLIPVTTLRIPSYSQRIEAVSSITSTAANVESQSLVLAYGGPDIFFTRLSPSRGFDLLPDSFNRALLSIVVVALCMLVGTVKKMSTKKMLGVSWA